MRPFLYILLLSLFYYSPAWSQVTPVEGYVTDTSLVSATKLTIRKIVIQGNDVTRRSVILREIGVHEGDVIERDSVKALLERNRLRLFNMQLFNEVTQNIIDEPSGRGIDLYIKVKERWNIIPSVFVQFADQNFNTWWVKENHDLRRAMAGVTLTDKNFRGNLETLAVTVQAGYTQELGIGYMRPYVNHGQTNGLGFWVSAAQSRQTYYATDSDKFLYAGIYSGPVILRQVGGGISYIYRPAYASKHIFQVNYKDYLVSDTIVKLNPDYYTNKSKAAKLVEIVYRYDYNGVDNWNYSLKGFKLVSQFVVRTGFEGINFQGYANVEAGLFRKLGAKFYFSTIFRGRLMYPGNQPYYFRGGLGTQTDYVRGYEYYVVDGSNYGLLRLDLKREIFNNTYSIPVKYFTAIPVRVYPKVFADVGYIDGTSQGSNYLGNHLLYSVGIGLDVLTLYDIKIRFELAWNHLNQNGLYLHFNSE